MNLPIIRIKDAWLLRENASEHLDNMWRKDDDKPIANNPDYDKWLAEKVASYQKAWTSDEEKILTSMCRLLGLKFKQNIIDVYVAPWFYAFSDPMVMGVIFEPDEFVDNLTHETVHRLLTDNTITSPDFDYLNEWKKLFGTKYSFNTLVHIPVHAVHKAIYLDVLKQPKRLEREKQALIKNKANDYMKSWDYVDKHGHEEIIEKLRNSYTRLQKESNKEA